MDHHASATISPTLLWKLEARCGKVTYPKLTVHNRAKTSTQESSLSPIPLSVFLNILAESNLIFFWFSRFGWFGMDVEEVSNPMLNYIGAGLSVVRSAAITSH